MDVIIGLLTLGTGLLAKIVTAVMKRERETGMILSKIETLEKDVDGIASFIGTPRSKAKKLDPKVFDTKADDDNQDDSLG